MENIFNLLDELRKLNLRANEEKRIKIIYKNTYDEYFIHHIPLKLKGNYEINELYKIKLEKEMINFDMES